MDEAGLVQNGPWGLRCDSQQCKVSDLGDCQAPRPQQRHRVCDCCVVASAKLHPSEDGLDGLSAGQVLMMRQWGGAWVLSALIHI